MLSQIYREKAGYEKFLADACGDICLEDLLKEQGINTLREESLVSTSFGPQLVDEVQKHPHIIQYLIEEWRPSEVVIGDPLKLGKLYLPDPEKK